MKCPRDASDLAVVRYEADIEIDRCPACQGAWLDGGELRRIQQTIEKDHSKGDAPNSSVKESYDSVAERTAAPIECLKCGETMIVRPYGFGTQVTIDSCANGCGIWLDGGELEALERVHERGQAEGALPIHWRIWGGIVGALRSKRESP